MAVVKVRRTACVCVCVCVCIICFKNVKALTGVIVVGAAMVAHDVHGTTGVICRQGWVMSSSLVAF